MKPLSMLNELTIIAFVYAMTDAFFRDIKNKGFAFLLVNDDDKYISFEMQKYSLSINEKGHRPNLLSNISFL